MFLTSKDLLPRFQELLVDSERIRVASAWATTGFAFDRLIDWANDHPSSLQVLIGVQGNATDPEALSRLAQVGELRIAERSGPMFHPKVYLFEGRCGPVAWVGSANFTNGGFENNDEAVLEVANQSDCESVARWFSERWNRLLPATKEEIDEYRKQWRRRPPERGLVSVSQGTFEIVEGPEATKQAIYGVEAALRSSREVKGTISTPRGQSPGMQMYLHSIDGAELWSSFNSAEEQQGGYWNLLGIRELESSKSAQVPVVQLNPPVNGGLDLRYGAVFLKDLESRVHLGHTGSLQMQGLGHGKPRRHFLSRLARNGQVVTVRRPEQGDDVSVAVIGRIDSDDFRDNVLRFVLQVKECKDELKKPSGQ